MAWMTGLVAATAVYAAAIGLTGGFKVSVAGLRFSSHSWERPALLAAIGAIGLVIVARARIAAAFQRLAVNLDSESASRLIVVGATLLAVAIGLGFGTFANGGADSYGYVGQARLLAQGRLTDTIPVNRDYPWPNVEYTLTPLGFTKGQRAGVISPMYPPGLPLLLAPVSLLSETAIYLVVPLFGALLVWLTYYFGVLNGDGFAGAVAALFVAFSPTFVYQLVQPMSDVPAAAVWLGALIAASRASRAGSVTSGVLSSVAILIRPNLAPLAAIVAALSLASNTSDRLRCALYFLASIVPGIVLLGWIQDVRYGSPFASGYGTASDVFAFEYVVPNLARYPRWITVSHTPFIWLSLAAPFWIARRAKNPRLAWAGLLLSAAVWVAYLPYIFFQADEWFYTRFLLPAIPIMLFFAAACAVEGLRALPSMWRFPFAAILVIVISASMLAYAERHRAFELRNQERKYPLAGEYVRTRGPANAFVLAAQHSGSIRYYAHRPILRWDLLSPTRLDQALAIFRAQGFEPILVVDAAEDRAFRERFAATGQRAVEHLIPLAVVGDTRIFAFR
jgi:hypothetical protein